MKRKINLKNLRHFGGLLILLTAFAVGPAWAETITKSFEFGAGTAYSTSVKRNFYVPCHLNVSVMYEFYRLGDTGEAHDVKIVFVLYEPGATADEEGRAAEVSTLMAKRERLIATVSANKSNRGCSLPWSVRVRAFEGTSPVAIKGAIHFSYDGTARNIGVEGGLISLNKGNSVTKNVGSSLGFGHGVFVITANWNHAIGAVIGPNPVRLKFELINPSGTVVKTVSAYSSNEIRSDLEKFRLTYQVPDCVGLGQWKLRITNNTNDDTMNIDPKVQFTPDCP